MFGKKYNRKVQNRFKFRCLIVSTVAEEHVSIFTLLAINLPGESKVQVGYECHQGDIFRRGKSIPHGLILKLEELAFLGRNFWIPHGTRRNQINENDGWEKWNRKNTKKLKKRCWLWKKCLHGITPNADEPYQSIILSPKFNSQVGYTILRIIKNQTISKAVKTIFDEF